LVLEVLEVGGGDGAPPFYQADTNTARIELEELSFEDRLVWDEGKKVAIPWS